MKELEALRRPAEEDYRTEIDALISAEKDDIPEGWRMSPRSVLTYVAGGKAKGVDISPKYIGHKRLVEISIATLLTDRGLLLMGEPGTAKSWLSEHLAAAICGDSTKVVQGTMGTTEEQIKYSWNYALLIAHGPSNEALVRTPIWRAMETGSIARFEEISRAPSEVQDALISLLSEKCIAIPELAETLRAERGFALIATANTRDKGVNDMSAALKRRFNMVILPAPATRDAEVEIVSRRTAQLSASLKLKAEAPAAHAVEKVVTIFRELRMGQTLDGKEKVKSPSSVMSTAEAISLLVNAMSLAASFGDGRVREDELAAGLLGAVVKDDEKDAVVFKDYLENVAKKRDGDWRGLYASCRELLP
ncbi:ATPase [Alphaproteobacteria bacterium]|nr:ATPase [Alphaproteobacteria bacterium]